MTIKITFVAELGNLLDESCIYFRLPTTVAPSGGSTDFKLSLDLDISTHSKIESIKSERQTDNLLLLIP